jgi:bifunctional non-homologous end joining protein LigD
LLFYAFDVLVCRGRSLLKEPLSERREILSDISKGIKAAPIGLGQRVSTQVQTNWSGSPGSLGSRASSPSARIPSTNPASEPEPGSSTRSTGGQEFIGGYTPDNPFDSLIVGYYEGERLLYAAKVRNGSVPQLRRDGATKFKGLATDACPFANLPEKKRTHWALTKEEIKNCVWLRPDPGRPNRVHRMDA